MPTEKKHIAVYLAPEIEAALVTFCEQKGLKSKKGTMFSAGVNTALAEFFGIADIKGGNIAKGSGNIPVGISNTPNQLCNIPTRIGSNILAGSVAVEVLPRKTEGLSNSFEVLKPHIKVTQSELQTELGNLKTENEHLKANYAKLLESSTHITNKLRQEVQELRSQLETERASREEIETELSELNKDSALAATVSKKLTPVKQRSTMGKNYRRIEQLKAIAFDCGFSNEDAKLFGKLSKTATWEAMLETYGVPFSVDNSSLNTVYSVDTVDIEESD